MSERGKKRTRAMSLCILYAITQLTCWVRYTSTSGIPSDASRRHREVDGRLDAQCTKEHLRFPVSGSNTRKSHPSKTQCVTQKKWRTFPPLRHRFHNLHNKGESTCVSTVFCCAVQGGHLKPLQGYSGLHSPAN